MAPGILIRNVNAACSCSQSSSLCYIRYCSGWHQRDAMDLAEEAEKENMKAACGIIQVWFLLRLGRPIPKFFKEQCGCIRGGSWWSNDLHFCIGTGHLLAKGLSFHFVYIIIHNPRWRLWNKDLSNCLGDEGIYI